MDDDGQTPEVADEESATNLESLSMDLAEHGGLRYADRIDISRWSGRGSRPSDSGD